MKWQSKLRALGVSKTAKQSAIVFILKLIGVLSFFLLSLFITNNFPSDDVGRYDFARSLLLIISGLNLLGFEQSIIYYSGLLKAEKKFLWYKILYKRMVGVVFILAILLLVLILIIPQEILNSIYQKDVYEVIIKVIAVVFFHSLLMLNIEFLRGHEKLYISESIRNVLRYVGFFLLAVALFYTKQYQWLAEVFLLNYVILGIVSSLVIYFKYLYKIPKYNIDVKYNIKNVVLTSYPMAMSTMVYFLLQNTDIIILGKYVSYSQIAYYAVAVKVAMLSSVVMMAISTVLAPKISEAYALHKIQALRSMMRKSAFFIFLISLPFFIIIVVGGNFILKLFGPEYNEAIIPLYILVLGQLINALSGPTATYLNMTQRQKVLQYVLLVAFLVNICLNLILIPKYGIHGAAWATASTTVLWNIYVVLFIYYKDKTKIFLH